LCERRCDSRNILVSIDGKVLLLTQTEDIENESSNENSEQLQNDLKWKDYAQINVEIQSKEDGKIMRYSLFINQSCPSL